MTHPDAESSEPRGVADQGQERAGSPRAARTASRRAAEDTRGNREERHADDREAQDRETAEDREMNEAERLEFFKTSLMQELLPSLPKIPGYHVCWITTTHKTDTVAFRIRCGYSLIHASEFPGFDGSYLKAGDYAGVVSCNEMLAAKIPLSLFNKYMAHVHHTLPNEQADKIRVNIELMKQKAKAMGADLIEGDGTEELRARARSMPPLTE
jgi:hypothetical protein